MRFNAGQAGRRLCRRRDAGDIGRRADVARRN